MKTLISRSDIEKFMVRHGEDMTDVFRVEFGETEIALWRYRRKEDGTFMTSMPNGQGSRQVQVSRKHYAEH